jgi:hypothetical protein
MIYIQDSEEGSALDAVARVMRVLVIGLQWCLVGVPVDVARVQACRYARVRVVSGPGASKRRERRDATTT